MDRGIELGGDDTLLRLDEAGQQIALVGMEEFPVNDDRLSGEPVQGWGGQICLPLVHHFVLSSPRKKDHSE